MGGGVRYGVGFGAGPICPADDVVGERGGEQPLPRAIAAVSVAYVGSANIDVITHA